MEEQPEADEQRNGPRMLVSAAIAGAAIWGAILVIAWAVWWRP